MAKSTIPGLKSSGGVLPKLIGLTVLAAVLMLIVKHPANAATWVQSAGDWVGNAVDGLANFIQQCAS
ncbi:hypothetical protein [Amycolatopsis sp. CA-230715]|uniref:hypothetical protein n=1 Tax=Amycolatopsis sp. CA-230715 TaxID=2745196 RepID=UPI001C018E33|nr:hypothetical protein [Amycolatopsis sp. CA-230715]QWF80445.1 hypothetical protein HUW46_03867 [Amycolatopsis sp. CA-230715]